MTTYNVATEQAEKLAVRVNSKGGASAMEGEAGVYLLKPPASVSTAATAVSSAISISAVTVSGSSGAYTFSFTTGTQAFIAGQQVTVAGFTGTAANFNGTFTVLASGLTTTAFKASSTATTNVTPPGSYTGCTATTVAINGSGGTYYYFVTRVSNGVESFSNPATTLTVASTSATVSFTVTDQTANVLQPTTASSFNLYVGTTAANATLQATTGTTTLAWSAYSTSGTAYTSSPAVVSYPESATAFAAYQSPNYVTDALLHNPNATTGFSGTTVYGAENQVRQIRTSIVESQLYSRTDTATVTSGSGTVSDSSITWADFGKPVTGTGIPTNAYVGTVTSGTSFVLSSVQGQNVPYWPGTTNAFQATANGTSITVTGSNVGPLPVQVGQYRTSRWQG